MKRPSDQKALWLDKWVLGVVVHMVSWLVRVRHPQIKPATSPRTVVVAKYVGLGSILLMEKLLYAVKTRYPEAKIIFVSFSANQKLLEKMRHLLDETLIIDSHSAYHFFSSAMRVLRALRCRGVDLFLDAEFFSRFSCLMAYFSGSKYRVGFDSAYLTARSSLYNVHAKYVETAHISDNFLNLLRSYDDGNVFMNFESPSLIFDLNQNQEKKLSDMGLSREYLVFNPSASEALSGYRKWSTQKWASLIHLCRSTGYHAPILLSGLQADRKSADEIIDCLRADVHGNPGVINGCGLFDLDEYLALLKKAKAVVTVDSGTAHFSVALKTPTVVLFGPETPRLYGYKVSWYQDVYKNLFCSPCYNIFNGKKITCYNQHRCMAEITPGDVFAKLKTFVDMSHAVLAT